MRAPARATYLAVSSTWRSGSKAHGPAITKKVIAADGDVADMHDSPWLPRVCGNLVKTRILSVPAWIHVDSNRFTSCL
jgi:hypothetical protein